MEQIRDSFFDNRIHPFIKAELNQFQINIFVKQPVNIFYRTDVEDLDSDAESKGIGEQNLDPNDLVDF